jgi:hypothetical protein
MPGAEISRERTTRLLHPATALPSVFFQGLIRDVRVADAHVSIRPWNPTRAQVASQCCLCEETGGAQYLLITPRLPAERVGSKKGVRASHGSLSVVRREHWTRFWGSGMHRSVRGHDHVEEGHDHCQAANKQPHDVYKVLTPLVLWSRHPAAHPLTTSRRLLCARTPPSPSRSCLSC